MTEAALESVLTDLLEARERGETIDRPAWLARHPHLADDLHAYFQADEDLTPFVAPLRDVFGGTDEEADEPAPQLDQVEVLGELGRGGMGVVYRVRDLRLDRLEALKVLHPQLVPTEGLLRRLEEEARTVARLDHPGIVRLYLLGESDGRPYLRMELVEGESLASLLDKGPLREDEAADLVARLARAVQHAHEQGVVHRDLKPANVLLQRRAGASGALLERVTPRITDFGLALQLTASRRHSLPGTIIGSAGYMAPEQARGQENVGPAADVYALGAILYECLTGRPVFEGELAIDVILRGVSEAPVPPRTHVPALDPGLEAICLRCLEKDPARRWPSAAALADALTEHLRKEEKPAPPPRRAVAVAAGLALLLALTVAAWLAWKPGPAREPVPAGEQPPAAVASGPLALLQLVRGDLEASAPAERARLRYLTLSHLAGSPSRTEGERERWRAALAALGAWWSEAGRQVSLRAIDPERLVYRLDLEQLGPAGEAAWHALLETCPYLVHHQETGTPALRSAEADVARLAGTQAFSARGDWLLYRLEQLASAEEPSPLLPRRPWPAALAGCVREYRTGTLDLAEAAHELGTGADTLRRLLEEDVSVWSRSVAPLLRGERVERRTWESLEQTVSPFQYLAGELGLGTPFRP